MYCRCWALLDIRVNAVFPRVKWWENVGKWRPTCDWFGCYSWSWRPVCNTDRLMSISISSLVCMKSSLPFANLSELMMILCFALSSLSLALSELNYSFLPTFSLYTCASLDQRVFTAVRSTKTARKGQFHGRTILLISIVQPTRVLEMTSHVKIANFSFNIAMSSEAGIYQWSVKEVRLFPSHLLWKSRDHIALYWKKSKWS